MMATVSLRKTALWLGTVMILSAVRGLTTSEAQSDAARTSDLQQKVSEFAQELLRQDLNDEQRKLVAAELETLLGLNGEESGHSSRDALTEQLDETEDFCDTEMPRDCADIFASGQNASGVYTVYVGYTKIAIEVYCDMTTDGGGWTVFQRRQDGSVEFSLNWDNYTNGFGDLNGEFWLGLFDLHRLTFGRNSRLRVDLADFGGNTSYAEYADFIVASDCDEYKISYSVYCGNAGDSLSLHNGQRFSTWDNDNDNHGGKDCADIYSSGWWFTGDPYCYDSNLNGLYPEGIAWGTWTGDPLKFTEMKVRPSEFSIDIVCKSSMPRDCADIKAELGQEPSGVYTVYVDSAQRAIQVYCDMETDDGGWTVFQRRQDGSVDFYRNWANYSSGFGDFVGEFWLGNDNIYSLTAGKNYHLRVDLEDFEANTRYAEYSDFTVMSACNEYKMSYSTYCGTAGDALIRHNLQRFSTWDVDNDLSGDNCAETYKGAWWYESCVDANLNGLYLHGPHESFNDGVNWDTWLGPQYSLKFTEMKIRPSVFSRADPSTRV